MDQLLPKHLLVDLENADPKKRVRVMRRENVERGSRSDFPPILSELLGSAGLGLAAQQAQEQQAMQAMQGLQPSPFTNPIGMGFFSSSGSGR